MDPGSVRWVFVSIAPKLLKRLVSPACDCVLSSAAVVILADSSPPVDEFTDNGTFIKKNNNNPIIQF